MMKVIGFREYRRVLGLFCNRTAGAALDTALHPPPPLKFALSILEGALAVDDVQFNLGTLLFCRWPMGGLI